MQVYYDKDADLSLIKGKTVAIIGYGQYFKTGCFCFFPRTALAQADDYVYA